MNQLGYDLKWLQNLCLLKNQVNPKYKILQKWQNDVDVQKMLLLQAFSVKVKDAKYVLTLPQNAWISI